jgi:hypothetical protein
MVNRKGDSPFQGFKPWVDLLLKTCLHPIGIKFLLNFMVSRTLAICFPFFGNFFKNEKKSPKLF